MHKTHTRNLGHELEDDKGCSRRSKVRPSRRRAYLDVFFIAGGKCKARCGSHSDAVWCRCYVSAQREIIHAPPWRPARLTAVLVVVHVVADAVAQPLVVAAGVRVDAPLFFVLAAGVRVLAVVAAATEHLEVPTLSRVISIARAAAAVSTVVFLGSKSKRRRGRTRRVHSARGGAGRGRGKQHARKVVRVRVWCVVGGLVGCSGSSRSDTGWAAYRPGLQRGGRLMVKTQALGAGVIPVPHGGGGNDGRLNPDRKRTGYLQNA